MTSNETTIIKGHGLLRWLAVIGTVLGMFSTLQSVAVLPYRVTANEDKIKQMELLRAQDHDLLVGISAEVKAMRSEMNRFYHRTAKNEE